MALFNYVNREITAKIVYYGPGVCGKTTSLQFIHERIAPSQRGRLLSLATETDRTIFFDLLPLKLGEIRGFKLRFQLYTVPGQVKYNKTRKLVLQGADAIVFVADSDVARREANIESFGNLQENLKEQGKQLENIPIVYEYNKRDLPRLISVEELNKTLNPGNLPYFPTVAIKGVGVMETLESISRLALHDIEKRLTPETTAESAVSETKDEDLELIMTEGELQDLTGPPEPALDLSTEELGAIDLEPEWEKEEALETKPIGYDNDVPIQEIEIDEEQVAHAGTLKESEFFDLQTIEDQALRELEDFLGGKETDEFSFEQAASPTPSFQEESELALSLGEEAIAEKPDFELGRTFDERDTFAFSADEDLQGFTAFSREETEQEEPSLPTLEDTELLEFNLGEEPQEMIPEQTPLESSAKGAIESLDIEDSELDLTLGEEEAPTLEMLPSFALDEEDFRGESTSLTAEEEELTAFGPELAETEETAGSEFEFSEEEFAAQPEMEFSETVEAEMEVSEEISSVTPFEQQLDELSEQLDELSEEMFTAEAEIPSEEFQPEISEAGKEEAFQMIADEWTRIATLAKYHYHHGEIYRAKQTVSDNIMAILMYYTAIETAVKAVASKYETCNPEIASLRIIFDSIEEETGKTLHGKLSVINNIADLRNKLQLETIYPDDDSCEIAAKTCERFLTALMEEFLEIDFAQLSPVLARPKED